MTEAWRTTNRLYFERAGDRHDLNFRALENWAPEEIVIEDTGAADTVVTITHGLRRVPRGAVIMNQVVPGGTDPVLWYRVDGDAAWTGREISMRFTVANAAIRLWIW